MTDIPDDAEQLLAHAEREMRDYASAAMEAAIPILEAWAAAARSGTTTMHFKTPGEPDELEVVEAAAALRLFPPYPHPTD